MGSWAGGIPHIHTASRHGDEPSRGHGEPQNQGQHRRPTTRRSDTARRPIFTVGRDLQSNSHTRAPRGGPARIPRQGRTHGARRDNHGNELRACRNLGDGELIRIFRVGLGHSLSLIRGQNVFPIFREKKKKNHTSHIRHSTFDIPSGARPNITNVRAPGGRTV